MPRQYVPQKYQETDSQIASAIRSQQEDYPPGLQECVDHINWVISEAQKGVNPMNEQKLSRKWHLTNIKEWLDLAQTPLLKAQQGMGVALQELCQNHDTVGMVGGTDIAHGINTSLVMLMHSMDLVELALTQLDQPSESTLPSENPKLPLLYCDSCKRAFCADYGVEPGDDCPFCSEGHVWGLFSEPETTGPQIDKDKDHSDTDGPLMCTQCSYKPMYPDKALVTVPCPQCHDGIIMPDGIPF